MRFPTHFSKAKNSTGRVCAYGWSDTSLQEAQAHAQKRLEKILNHLRAQSQWELDHYSYDVDGVILEEQIEHLTLPDQSTAVISRNRYGALVLNVANVPFIDVDVPHPPKKSQGLLSRLLKKPPPPTYSELLATELHRIADWQTQHPDLSLACYRTHSGFRLVVLNQTFPPDSPAARQLLEELCNDPLYKSLCLRQQCYRARLTPKPWRISVPERSKNYPDLEDPINQELQTWDANYAKASKEYSVCTDRLLLGSAPLDPTVEATLAIHDHWTLGDETKPLA